MAAPALIDAQTASASAVTTLAVPALTGSTGKYGLLMVLMYAGSANAPGVPSGWTLVGTAGGDAYGVSGGQKVWMYEKTVLEAGDVGGFNLTADGSTYMGAVLASYTAGSKRHDFQKNAVVSAQDGSGVNLTNTAVDVQDAESLVVWFVMAYDNGGDIGTPVSGVTEDKDVAHTLSALLRMGLYHTSSPPSLSASYTKTFTIAARSIGGTATSEVFCFVLQPALFSSSGGAKSNTAVVS